MIPFHIHPLRIHDRYTGTVLFKRIVEIHIIIGKHKVNSVANIIFTQIILNGRKRNKFKIDPVPLTLYMIAIDQCVV